METTTFLMHFAYIGGFFAAGFALGVMFKDQAGKQLNKLFKRKA
jgi:gas vesicle protein